jgi:hypothetical protein
VVLLSICDSGCIAHPHGTVKHTLGNCNSRHSRCFTVQRLEFRVGAVQRGGTKEARVQGRRAAGRRAGQQMGEVDSELGQTGVFVQPQVQELAQFSASCQLPQSTAS